MKSTRLVLAALVVCLAVAGRPVAVAEELPPAPAGFTWQRLPEMKGVLPLPSSWKHQCCQGDMGWRSTETETGVPDPARFTLNLIRSGRSRSRQDAENIASEWLTGVAKALKPLETWSSTHGPFVGKAGIYVDEQERTSPRHRAYIQVLVSPRTSTLCMVVFDAPSSQWDAKWKVGKVIADGFVIDDEM